jgi:hypothetical protein
MAFMLKINGTPHEVDVDSDRHARVAFKHLSDPNIFDDVAKAGWRREPLDISDPRLIACKTGGHVHGGEWGAQHPPVARGPGKYKKPRHERRGLKVGGLTENRSAASI